MDLIDQAKKEMLKELTTRENAHQSDLKVVKEQFNAKLLVETEKAITDIIKNYNCGFLTMNEMVHQRMAVLRYCSSEIVEIKYGEDAK